MVTKSKATVKPSVATEHTEHLYAERLGALLPSTRRVFVATFVAVLTSFGVGYIVGALTDLAMTAALVYTGSMFLSTCILIMGIVIAIMAGARIGSAAALFVLGYKPGTFADAGAVIRDASRRKISLVRDWFTPADRIDVSVAR